MFFLKLKNESDFKTILDNVPGDVKEALLACNVGPVKLLRDMRQTLAKINSDGGVSNKNICSVPVRSISIETRGTIDQRRVLYQNTWLDLGMLSMTLDLAKKEVMMRIPYQLLKKVHFTSSTTPSSFPYFKVCK